MTRKLDLGDIQGNILSPYGLQGFPKARYLLFSVKDAEGGRAFVRAVTAKTTTALRWPSKALPKGEQPRVSKPKVAVNLAFTFSGLLALGVPTRTLRGLPDEFIDGMARRARILGDDFPANAPDKWDPVWQKPSEIHILVTLNAQLDPQTGQPVPELEERTRWLIDLCADGKVVLMDGHRNPGDSRWQDASAVFIDGKPTPKEHFGFTDGIGNPVFEGQFGPELEAVQVVGNGKLLGKKSADEPNQWVPLATGEFLLGYPDEAQEVAGAAMPWEFSRNGTFMSYRKLHENVVSFRRFLDRAADGYAKAKGINKDDAKELVMAKMAGRWSDGVPLSVAPTFEAWADFRKKPAEEQRRLLTDFTYADDKYGVKCPVTAHMRRANTRDMLDPTLENGLSPNGSVLNNRRRILRRGLPYGETPPKDAGSDDGNHGIIMLSVCASLFRQFEFVQQQWMQFGLDFNAGNETCPLIGNHGQDAKFVIAADPATGEMPYFLHGIPQFVETRGGEYFFVPSMTALRLIGMGIIDPT